MTQIWAAYGFMFAMIGLLYVLAARNRAEAAGELAAVFSADKGYVDQDSVVTLFDAHGQFLQLPAKRWARALGTAMAHGWRPAGAAPPPRHWGLNVRPQPQEQWDGRYEEPLGQCVTAPDAQQFAQALGRAMEREGNAKLAQLAGFANAGSFLVCPLTAELRGALKAMPQTAADLERPEELGLDLENLRRRLEGFRAATQGNGSLRYYAAELRAMKRDLPMRGRNAPGMFAIVALKVNLGMPTRARPAMIPQEIAAKSQVWPGLKS